MNSVANGVLFEKTKYNNIYIPPAPGDAGGSLGSAAYQINKINNHTDTVEDKVDTKQEFLIAIRGNLGKGQNGQKQENQVGINNCHTIESKSVIAQF